MDKILTENKKVGFNYIIDKIYNCGVILTGSEVKMVKNKRYHFKETFCYIKNSELWVKNFYIDEYGRTYLPQDPKRDKKLLVKKKELKLIENFSKIKSNTIVPMTLFLNDKGLIKIKIGLGTGKKNYDKRQSLKEKEMKRDIERVKTTKGH